ncbi:MAG: recombinase [Opitutales bacterium]|nr:recombinase [Opitutales bacterium]
MPKQPSLSPELFLPRREPLAILPENRRVVKRDGREVIWDVSKIIRAVALAFYEVRHETGENPYRDDPQASYGLSAEDSFKVSTIAQRVSQMLELSYRKGKNPTIEEIQDIVEMAIAAEGEWNVARAYILYRQKQAERRITRFAENGLKDYIAVSKYARYREDLGRRETFPEAVERVAGMHRRRFGEKLSQEANGKALENYFAKEKLSSEMAAFWRNRLAGRSFGDLVDEAFAFVARKKVLPSMRSLQFGGVAIENCEARMFNCSFSPLDRLSFFREYFYLLLAGSGCGFSVQKHHLALLPALPKRPNEMDLEIEHHTVGDTIEGWADAMDRLIDSYWKGYKVEFNYSQIRHRGSPLKTSGGKAPGHIPLRRALTQVEKILEEADGRRLRPIEAYDMCMHIARSVLSGGIRRSATICLFSSDDEEMMNAKSGNWFEKHPQRSASNNSAVLFRKEDEFEVFQRLFEAQKEFGEPGFYFAEDPEYGCNPCCEIGLHPVVRGKLSEKDLQHLRDCGYTGDYQEGQRFSGWQMCNLSTVNAADCEKPEDFYEAAFHAALIGTLQASFTKIDYLGPVTRFLNEREALIGVSICGILDHPEIFLHPEVLENGAAVTRLANRMVADWIGIRPAARITCVKPEGTASLLLGAGSGIHPHHARRYFRRVQANRKDPVFQHFKARNAHMTEPSVYQPDTDDVITFPEEAPETAILRDQIGAVDFLQFVKRVQKHWVVAGNRHSEYSPGLEHNVSNTCTVKPEEWEAVREFIWANRQHFTGVALLQSCGDKAYAQAPREEVSTDEDIAKWNRLKYQEIDYTQLKEKEDVTSLKETVACAGGACELI